MEISRVQWRRVRRFSDITGSGRITLTLFDWYTMARRYPTLDEPCVVYLAVSGCYRVEVSSSCPFVLPAAMFGIIRIFGGSADLQRSAHALALLFGSSVSRCQDRPRWCRLATLSCGTCSLLPHKTPSSISFTLSGSSRPQGLRR